MSKRALTFTAIVLLALSVGMIGWAHLQLKDASARLDALEGPPGPKGEVGVGIREVQCTSLPAGSQCLASFEDGVLTLRLVIPPGEKGDKGDRGAKGVKGDRGRRGAQGNRGRDGVTTVIQRTVTVPGPPDKPDKPDKPKPKKSKPKASC